MNRRGFFRALLGAGAATVAAPVPVQEPELEMQMFIEHLSEGVKRIGCRTVDLATGRVLSESASIHRSSFMATADMALSRSLPSLPASDTSLGRLPPVDALTKSHSADTACCVPASSISSDVTRASRSASAPGLSSSIPSPSGAPSRPTSVAQHAALSSQLSAQPPRHSVEAV